MKRAHPCIYKGGLRVRPRRNYLIRAYGSALAEITPFATLPLSHRNPADPAPENAALDAQSTSTPVGVAADPVSVAEVVSAVHAAAAVLAAVVDASNPAVYFMFGAIRIATGNGILQFAKLVLDIPQIAR